MAEWQGEIEGNLTLEQIDAAVDNVEAGGGEFLRSTVATPQAKPTNVAVFKRLPPGQRPKEFILSRQSDAAPQNATKIWSGVMLVEGRMTAVVAYRET